MLTFCVRRMVKSAMEQPLRPSIGYGAGQSNPACPRIVGCARPVWVSQTVKIIKKRKPPTIFYAFSLQREIELRRIFKENKSLFIITMYLHGVTDSILAKIASDPFGLDCRLDWI